MFPSHRSNPSAYDDDWEDQPGEGLFYQWGLGILLPVVFVIYGSCAIYNHEATFGTRIAISLHNQNAIAIGIAAVCAGLFVHCHYFWGNIYNQAWFAVLGKIISALGFICGLGFVLVRFGVMGMK